MKDLTMIPERFHVLFQTDWLKGNESKMSAIKRSEMNNLYLEYNRWEINQRLNKIIEEEEKPFVGFPKITI